MKIKIFLILILFFCYFNAFGGISISSKYIEVVMDIPSGRFFLKSIKGDPDIPTDDNKNLLFDKIPPTTYPTLFVDGDAFVVGTDDGYFDGNPNISKGKLVWTWRPNKYSKIKFLQIIEIVTNPFTSRDDMARVSYIVVNEDKVERTVNVRLLLDTVLGEGDNAPFFVSGYGKIERETVFYEGNMPYYWYSFDSLKSPKVRVMGIVNGFEDVSTPSMLVFSTWRKLDKARWEYIPEVGASFSEGLFGGRDTAVAIYFKPTKLKPQELTLYSTMFGIYGDVLKTFENVSLSLSLPDVVSSFPFNTSLSIENTSKVELKDVRVVIDVNTNYFFVSNNSYFLSNLSPGGSVAFSWNIFNTTNTYDGEYSLKCQFSALAISTNVYEEISKTFKVSSGISNVASGLNELGIRQTNVNTNFLSSTNYLTLTNFVSITNITIITNTITNFYDNLPIDDIERIKSIIERLNRRLDSLIATYYLSISEEEREKIRNEIEFIKQQLSIEKLKLKAKIGEF
ncbi:MAG: hypothetical protein ACP5QP_01955 [Brevinematia bacterium]